MNECSRCKKDVYKEPSKGGCYCCKDHPSGAVCAVHYLDEHAYDGYGYWDYSRYLVDHF